MIIKKKIILPCSGCNGQAMFTPEGELPMFLHTIPYCARFDGVNTIDELLAYFRECGEKAETKKRN